MIMARDIYYIMVYVKYIPLVSFDLRYQGGVCVCVCVCARAHARVHVCILLIHS